MFARMANLLDDPMQHYLNKESWLVDSGATVHVTNDATCMRNIHMTNEKIVVGNRQTVTPKLAGDIYLVQKPTSKVLLLSNVLYVPNFRKNLISIGVIIDKGNAVTMNEECMMLSKNEAHISFEQKSDGMFLLGRKSTEGECRGKHPQDRNDDWRSIG